MIARKSEIMAESADALKCTAEAFSRIAIELSAAAQNIEGDAEHLRQQAIGLQAESMRAAMAALTARGVAERLGTLARIEASE
jgi:hypothetical protein